MAKTNEQVTNTANAPKLVLGNTSGYTPAQADELCLMKQMLQECNLSRYETLLKTDDDIVARTRLFPITPMQQAWTYEQFLKIQANLEATIGFAPKLVTLDANEDNDAFTLKDAIVKVKFVGDRNEYTFYSWDFEHMSARIFVGYSGNIEKSQQAFLMDVVYDNASAWELEKFIILGGTDGHHYRKYKKPEALGENIGLAVYFDKSRELLRFDTLNLGFTPSYFECGEVCTEGRWVEEMKWERVRVTAAQSEICH